MASGIDTFFDAWEIRSGDSLWQRTDAGIEGCTHFLVFLSPTSLIKPWTPTGSSEELSITRFHPRLSIA